MRLNIEEWKEFKVGKVFKCETTSAIETHSLIDGDIPYITRSTEDNGCSGYFGNKEKVVKGHCITIGAEGKRAFYQKDDFIPGVKVYVLRNPRLNEKNGLFLTTVLNKEEYLYSYGRARILSKIKEEIIRLPICYETSTGGTKTPKIDPTHKYSDEGYVPDFDYMETYIKSLQYSDRI